VGTARGVVGKTALRNLFEKPGYVNAVAYGRVPCRLGQTHFCTLNNYSCTVLVQLMLPASATFQWVSGRSYPRVFTFVSVRHPPPGPSIEPNICLFILNCAG